MQSPLIEGRRFLLCHSIVHEIMGSTVVTLDLAEYLRDAGAEVLVYAAYVGGRAGDLFAERGIDVVSDDRATDLRFDDFDVVWVNSQVLPVGMVDQLGDSLPTQPVFIFLHMSALAIAPDEHPYILGLEERLASLSLFNSVETMTELASFFEHRPPAALYPNPTPAGFAAVHRPRPVDFPHSVLVVSNHADPELMDAKRVLAEQGLTVRHVGRSGEGQSMVTPDLLASVDVVVTIGKTVQYCLVAGVPVFVYDKHGGYGYLDDATFEHAAAHNFSGREGRRRTAQEIADEITTGFHAATEFHTRRREEFIDAYSIDRVVPPLLEELEPRRLEPLEPRLLAVVRSAQIFGARFYRYWGRISRDERAIARLEGDLHRALADAETARHEAQRRHDEDRATVDGLHAEIARIRRSWTFRTGRVIVRPIGSLARGLRRLLRG